MGLVVEQWEFLQDLAKLIAFIDNEKLVATGGELWRTAEMQEIYLRTGKTKTLKSNHLRRLAIDLNFFNYEGAQVSSKKDLQKVGDYWESLNEKNRWGGNWTSFLDCPHFERNV